MVTIGTGSNVNTTNSWIGLFLVKWLCSHETWEVKLCSQNTWLKPPSRVMSSCSGMGAVPCKQFFDSELDARSWAGALRPGHQKKKLVGILCNNLCLLRLIYPSEAFWRDLSSIWVSVTKSGAADCNDMCNLYAQLLDCEWFQTELSLA